MADATRGLKDNASTLELVYWLLCIPAGRRSFLFYTKQLYPSQLSHPIVHWQTEPEENLQPWDLMLWRLWVPKSKSTQHLVLTTPSIYLFWEFWYVTRILGLLYAFSIIPRKSNWIYHSKYIGNCHFHYIKWNSIQSYWWTYFPGLRTKMTPQSV